MDTTTITRTRSRWDGIAAWRWEGGYGFRLTTKQLRLPAGPLNGSAFPTRPPSSVTSQPGHPPTAGSSWPTQQLHFQPGHPATSIPSPVTQRLHFSAGPPTGSAFQLGHPPTTAPSRATQRPRLPACLLGDFDSQRAVSDLIWGP